MKCDWFRVFATSKFINKEVKRGKVPYDVNIRRILKKMQHLPTHIGSAGSMEAEGVVRCFQKSVETRQLRYETYIGDGDSKAYSSVVSIYPYPGFTVQKGECIGHIQKRVGSRLRRLVYIIG